jgi:selenocysteine lyase/cysteine desulfurase
VEIDIELVRQQTPACLDLVHFNNAGCSLMPLQVQEKVFSYLKQEQEKGGYETALARRDELSAMYQSIAAMLNCNEDEVAYCESNTKGWQQFFYSLRLTAGDNIITTRVDYGSNMVAYIQAAKRTGVEIRYIGTDELGDLDLASLERNIDARTRLVSISHIPTGNGLVNPAQAVGRIANQANIPYLLDACQSAGQLQLDVGKIGCTALTATGRKYMRGPRGTGFCFIARAYFENAEPMILEQQGVRLIDESNYQLADSARRFENFEGHFGGKIGLKAAVDYAGSIGLQAIEKRVFAIARSCRRKLSSITGVTIHDSGRIQCGIVSFSVKGWRPEDTRQALNARGINTWVCTGPGSLVDYQSRGLESTSRASLHYFNTEQEIDTLCGEVEELVRSGH